MSGMDGTDGMDGMDAEPMAHHDVGGLEAAAGGYTLELAAHRRRRAGSRWRSRSPTRTATR